MVPRTPDDHDRMTKPRATWTLWLKVQGGAVFTWEPLCHAMPGYYFTAREVLKMVREAYPTWPGKDVRILPAGKVPK